MKGLKHMFSERRFRAGGYSVLAAVIVIVIAVLVNLVVGSLPVEMTQIDVTSQSLYTLSDQTRQIVKALDKDVTLNLIAYAGNEDDGIVKLLSRYTALSDHITVTYTDPAEEPGILDTYPELSYANSVIVQCGDAYKVVSYASIYETNYDNYYTTGTTETTFCGENCLTSAIHYVTSENLPKVYLLTGHGEGTLSDSVKSLLSDDNFSYEDLSLLSLDAVPEDADCVLINGPTGDLSAEEAQMLNTYLDNGGNVILFTGYLNEGELPNLLSVAEHEGLSLQYGLIVEGDSNRSLRGYSYYLLPEISQTSEITASIANGGYYILVPTAEGIVQTGNEDATVHALLTTSESAYAKADGVNITTLEKEASDTDGPFNVAMSVESGDTHFVWTASLGMLDDSINQAVSGANGDYLMNALNWMCGQTESISIRTKSMSEESLVISQAQAATWTAVFVAVIPLTLLGAGVLIWFRRKRR